ncbi:endonuclease [Marivivens niveibacter]|uniref:Endonuclease n=1 Tax=Marivivens niveibacter TaxID=1930667 RepID=A0A251WWS2_9RHOB|nr:endonuclease [Marivivens niveibacter]
MTETVTDLPLVSADLRAQILSAPRTSDAHRELFEKTDAMHFVQTGGSANSAVLSSPVTISAWNVERCLFPTETADKLRSQGADIVLLSEVDHGMARTGQSHTTAEVAAQLGMAYIYGVEFFELGLGSPTEREFCKDTENARGWHGNAILSSVPFNRVAMIRLCDHGHWFSTEFGADLEQPRIGGRMALLAEVDTEQGPICVVSTHLESNSNETHRAAQFDILMDAVDDFAPDLPVVIGGDLNTGNHMPPDFDWKTETLFQNAQTNGYHWDGTADGMTTRPSLITRHPDRTMKLDWFACRGLSIASPRIIPSVNQGVPLSDHDLIVMECARQ